MTIDIRLPNITSPTEAGQLAQIKSYLHQLAEQLNIGLKSIETDVSANTELVTKSASAMSEKAQDNPQASFNAIKGLIIKDAEIIEAFSEEISTSLSGTYVAVSDFGTYMEETGLDIVLNSEKIQANFESVQSLSDTVQMGETSTKIISSVAWMKVGALESKESGHYLYGMEIGQGDTSEGETETMFARYTTEGVYLYDGNGDKPVAEITQGKLKITNAEIGGYLKLGQYRIETSNGLVFKWILG